MTRNLITELVIRLLAIWFLIRSFGSLLRSIPLYKDGGLSFWMYIIIFFIMSGIAILIIIFSERISNLIWIDRKIDVKIITNEQDNNIIISLISIVGLYFIIDSLAMMVQELADILVLFPTIYSSKDQYLYRISRLIYHVVLLVFGIVVFSFPEELMNIRTNVRKIFKREKINWENVEEE